MSCEEEVWEKLDAEFDHCVVDMKPYVLKLQHRSGAGTGIVGRKNRNLYAKLLLHMLKRGVLEGPFTYKPEPGLLKTLPSYMSIYFDEPNSTRVRSSSPDHLPDWVMGELGKSEPKHEESWRVSSKEESPLTYGVKPGEASECVRRCYRLKEIYKHNLCLDMKIKIVEAKFHEEKLKLQQKHDTDVQKILDRKNNEIEVLKTLYKTKQNEAEETIRKLEKKVQTLVRESQVVREAKEKQIAELKKMCEQSADSLNNEWEKRNQMVKELEARVQQLTVEAENSNLQRQKLSQEKIDAEQCYQAVCSELQEVKVRHSSLQKDRDRIIQEYEEKIQQLQSKYDVDISFLKQEHALSAAKASNVIEELEHNVSLLKQQLQESEHQKQQQLRDQDYKFQQDKLHLERVYEKQIHGIRNDLDKERGDAQKKIRKLEETLKEKEEQLTRVTEVQRLQAQQADAALEEFKRQVELNSEKVYAEMKEQMVELKLEQEQEKTHLFQQHNAEKDCLVRDHEREIGNLERQLRAAMAEHEQKTQECRKRDAQVICDMEAQIHKLREELVQVNAQRKQQLVELSLLREEEKQRAAREHEAAVSKLKAEAEKMTLDLKKVHAAETEKALEKKSLCFPSNWQQRQGLSPGPRAEELAADQRGARARGLRTRPPRGLLMASPPRVLQASGRLRHMEKEHGQKLAKSSQIIAELKTTISSLTEENSRQQLVAEQRLQEVVQKFEDKKQQLIRDNDRAIKALQDEMESYRSQVRAAEKKLQHRELETQEQMTHIRQEYETKLKGLMPASMRQELEDTIVSLKSQVTILQKRASVLQEELDTYRTIRPYLELCKCLYLLPLLRVLRLLQEVAKLEAHECRACLGGREDAQLRSWASSKPRELEGKLAVAPSWPWLRACGLVRGSSSSGHPVGDPCGHGGSCSDTGWLHFPGFPGGCFLVSLGSCVSRSSRAAAFPGVAMLDQVPTSQQQLHLEQHLLVVPFTAP
ncbi:PREDICTED: centrosomal protein of 112 kDa [Tinamus guttatus]|uniref:centrosomal protein of 112 kDa n=1 Tax=Tinamus guttatus TaxID=94827 RepID=UPI00052E96C7|nr:PREDICTED: centrosomal protein of 112 kDa [Tinamus guttatus]